MSNRHEQKYFDALEELAYEFRDDNNTCMGNCDSCPLSVELNDGIDACDFIISILNINVNYDGEC